MTSTWRELEGRDQPEGHDTEQGALYTPAHAQGSIGLMRCASIRGPAQPLVPAGHVG